MRFALGQLGLGADIQADLAAIDRFTAEAARDGAALVAFPEYGTYEKGRRTRPSPRRPSRWTAPSARNSPTPPAATASRWRRAWLKPRTRQVRRTTPVAFGGRSGTAGNAAASD